ncbi:MAG: hypothetical protein HGA86_00785, partial [Anaerolineaceae bacterium]|nr:hypothetical protein [Anaerolineaceae bacterium]
MPSQTAGRYLRMVFVFVLLVSLIFSNTGLMSVSKVYAQDQEPTPTPEVTLIESPVVTEEPTAVPAQPSGSLPNLSLIAPEGWDAAVVLSPIIGTHVTGTLTDGEVAYLDLAVFNQGSDIAGTFAVCLKIDGEQVQCWEANSLPAGEYFTVEDWAYTANRGAGSHHFELTVDANNMVTESDETDNTWVFDFTWLPSEMAGQSTGSPLINDVFQRPDLPDMQSQSATGSNLPGLDDVSPYMIGSIAVGVILPESSGTDENWTTTERNQVYDEIKEGLDRWVDWSKSNNSNTNSDNVDANVSFVYDYQYAIPTSVEPILTSSEDQCTWINEVMTNMGYTNPNGCWYQIYDYLDDLRTSTGTDWATAIFVVDSSVDDDGKFTNGYFGYAYFHGPFIVMT